MVILRPDVAEFDGKKSAQASTVSSTVFTMNFFKENMKSVAIFIDYFGQWPHWMPVFLASCRHNSTIDWIIRTDCGKPAGTPDNVKIIQTSFSDYIANVSSRLGINFQPSGSYKVCDVRPAYGKLYEEDLAEYDYYGFGDLDVIYGDIRKFYTDDVLSHDVISTHEVMLSGHLSLFKNTEIIKQAYLNIPNWTAYIENPESTRFDEDVYSLLFKESGSVPRPRDLTMMSGVRAYFKEQYTTVFHPMPWHDGQAEHPDVWYWRNGVVTNDRNSGDDYLYLHLMNFQSMRWASEKCREERTPWRKNPHVRFTLAGQEHNGVRIDWSGIHPML